MLKVIDVVILGVEVIDMEVGDEVVLDVVVRKEIPKQIVLRWRVIWLSVIGGSKNVIGVNISLGLVEICFEVIFFVVIMS